MTLFGDTLAPPLGGPVVEVCAVAKRDLREGEVLDDYGMYMTYGEAVNADEMSAARYLPEGLVEGCRLVRAVARDEVLTYDDVELPPGRLADRAPRRAVPPLPRRDLARRAHRRSRLTGRSRRRRAPAARPGRAGRLPWRTPRCEYSQCMCGICGVVQIGGEPRPVLSRGVLDRMTDVMSHRGPDDRGTFEEPGVAIGARRLSIVDVEGGHQPFASEDERVWAVQNGELYNHADLRRQLRADGHVFAQPLRHRGPAAPLRARRNGLPAEAARHVRRSPSGTDGGAGSSSRATVWASSRSTAPGSATSSSSGPS